MFTAIGRVAARRALLPSGGITGAQLTRSSVTASAGHGPSSSVFALPLRVRALSITPWMRSPAASKPKRKTSTASAAKKRTTKKKPAAKKKAKKPAAKKPKKKVKKEITPEEKEKKDLKQLKEMALLKTPTLLPETAWSVYVSENVNPGVGKLTDKVKELSSSFGHLSSVEKDRLASVSKGNSDRNKGTRRDFVESYPVEAIYMANIARRRIARKLNKDRVYLLHDERLPKRARTAYALFIKSRFSQASEGSAKDTFRALSQEWRGMSASEKQPFEQEAHAESMKAKEQLTSLKAKAKTYWKTHEGGSASQVPS